MSKIDTKLIWSITPFGIGTQGLQSVADILNQNQISIVRTTYSQYTKKIVQDLKSLLSTQKLEQNPHIDPTFLFEFVGRRCLICVPDNFVFQNSALIDVHFNVDFDFCAQNKIEKSASSHIEMKVSAADQLKKLRIGSSLDVSYGSVQLKVTKVLKRTKNSLHVKCKVIEGGTVFSGVKVHSTDMSRDLFPLLKEDKISLKNKFSQQADYLVISGIKSEEELILIKKSILGKSAKGSKRHPSVPITPNILNIDTTLSPRFLLKVGSKRSLALMSKVLPLIDGVFLSRADFGLDVHPYNLGILQKKIIETCNKNAKSIVVSSELMQSMRQNPTPTRAEVSDMANAMEDGADALVLSSAVTHGIYNKLVAQVSREVLADAEAWKAKKWKTFGMTDISIANNHIPLSDDDAVTYGAIRIAEQADISAIVCFTEGGYTAYKLSAMRTPKTIIAITCNKRIFRQLNLLHAVQPVILDTKLQTEKLLTHIKNILIKKFKFKHGEKFVFVSLTASSVSARNSNLFTLQEC